MEHLPPLQQAQFMNMMAARMKPNKPTTMIVVREVKKETRSKFDNKEFILLQKEQKNIRNKGIEKKKILKDLNLINYNQGHLLIRLVCCLLLWRERYSGVPLIYWAGLVTNFYWFILKQRFEDETK